MEGELLITNFNEHSFMDLDLLTYYLWWDKYGNKVAISYTNGYGTTYPRITMTLGVPSFMVMARVSIYHDSTMLIIGHAKT